MRIITGDECGLLKECIPETSRKSDDVLESNSQYHSQTTLEGVQRIDPYEEQSRSRGVIDLSWTSNSSSWDIPLEFAALRSNSIIEFWKEKEDVDVDDDDDDNGRNKKKQSVKKIKKKKQKSFQNYKRVKQIEDIFNPNSDDTYYFQHRPLAMACHIKKNRICACDTVGNVVILPYSNDVFQGSNDKSTTTQEKIHHFNAYNNSDDKNAKKTTTETIKYTPFNLPNQHLATAFDLDTMNDRFAIGGREREVRLFDIDTQKQIWKGKNLPPDPQTLLQHPIWPSAICFLSKSYNDNSTDNNQQTIGNNNVMVVGTAYAQVRLYDIRTPSNNKPILLTRRPISYTPDGLLEHRITSICGPIDSSGYTLVVGDTAGYIHKVDIRKNFTRDMKTTSNACSLGRYIGPAGSIRKIIKHETLPIFAVVGLDRMLRTYDIQSKKQLDCIYLKQRLNSLLISSRDGTWNSSSSSSRGKKNRNKSTRDNDDDDDDDSDDDDADSDADSDDDSNSNDSNSSDDDSSNQQSDDIDAEDVVENYVDSDDDDDDDDDDSDDDRRPSPPKKKKKRTN